MKNFWQTIKEKYPLAYKLFKDYTEPFFSFTIKDCYYFFDVYNIYCNDGLYIHEINSIRYAPFIIYNNQKIYTEFQYAIRYQAEQTMFLKAFEILNEQLKTKENEKR